MGERLPKAECISINPSTGFSHSLTTLCDNLKRKLLKWLLLTRTFLKLRIHHSKSLRPTFLIMGGLTINPDQTTIDVLFFHSTKYHQDEISLERSSSNVNQQIIQFIYLFSLYIYLEIYLQTFETLVGQVFLPFSPKFWQGNLLPAGSSLPNWSDLHQEEWYHQISNNIIIYQISNIIIYQLSWLR